MANDPFFRNLLAPPVGSDVAEQVGLELSTILFDPAQPIETKRHVAYYMAQVHEYRGEWDRVAKMLDYSGISIGRDDDSYDFLAHAGWTHVFRQGQNEAISRGVPAIYIVSLPQSGSSFVTAFVCAALGIEKCRTTKGPYMSSRLIHAWLSTFARGGAATHEHFIATPENIAVLETSDISTILVHVRHPLATLISGFRLHQNSDDADVEFFLKRLRIDLKPSDLRDKINGLANFASIFLPFIMQFMESWMNYSRRTNPKIKVHFSKYADETAAPTSFGERLISLFHSDKHGIDVDRVMSKLQNEARDDGAHNFKGGVSNTLMSSIDNQTRTIIDAILKREVLEFYGYEV
ncbi:MAG: hypothetical protein ACRECA_01430 [Pseudolabrys sp.]